MSIRDCEGPSAFLLLWVDRGNTLTVPFPPPLASTAPPPGPPPFLPFLPRSCDFGVIAAPGASATGCEGAFFFGFFPLALVVLSASVMVTSLPLPATYFCCEV